jgi:exodeoxyribonuclease VII small subunit
MASPKKSPSPQKDDLSKLSFEDAFQQLQEIVAQLESPELPLELLIERFEMGIKLVQVCRDKLTQAEIRIKQLEENLQGELKLKPVDMTELKTTNSNHE